MPNHELNSISCASLDNRKSFFRNFAKTGNFTTVKNFLKKLKISGCVSLSSLLLCSRNDATTDRREKEPDARASGNPNRPPRPARIGKRRRCFNPCYCGTGLPNCAGLLARSARQWQRVRVIAAPSDAK
jgi:hypothetical protein